MPVIAAGANRQPAAPPLLMPLAEPYAVPKGVMHL